MFIFEEFSRSALPRIAAPQNKVCPLSPNQIPNSSVQSSEFRDQRSGPALLLPLLELPTAPFSCCTDNGSDTDWWICGYMHICIGIGNIANNQSIPPFRYSFACWFSYSIWLSFVCKIVLIIFLYSVFIYQYCIKVEEKKKKTGLESKFQH